MKNFVIAVFLLLIAAAAVAVAWTLQAGVSARREPTAIESYVARRLRRLGIPSSARAQRNPLPASAEVLDGGREHFADHCAICHANDGSGDTEIGRGLYPKPPDMRKEPTQSLSDGELFYIIRNGIRFTGMPAWGSDEGEKTSDEKSEGDHGEEDNWELVHFIRHLPKITPQELAQMERLNPKSPAEAEEHSAAAHEHEHGHHGHHH